MSLGPARRKPVVVGFSYIFVRFRVTIDGTRSSRHQRDRSAGCFRSRVLIRARRQRTRRAKHHNCYQLDLVVLLPAKHALARKKSIDLVSLQHLPFILFEKGFSLHQVILEACRRRGFEPTVVARSSQIDFIVNLVATGLGIAFLPRIVAEGRRHPSVRLVRLAEPQTTWNIAMIWRRDAYLSHAAKAWLEIVCESHAKGTRGERPKPPIRR